ncbi:MAG: hypothetical protein WCQ21_16845, partial [Verrucomicrobiota bacterium]
MNIKLSIGLVYVGLLAVGYLPAAQSEANLGSQTVRQKCQAVQAKYDIVKAQWYDIYELGLVPGADQAGKLLTEAQQA